MKRPRAVRNLSVLPGDPNLINMSPVSLLFSSDEDTSRRLSQVLRELEFNVECCPEIFSAVKRLTSQSFDVIAADWDDGLEASFLLKTSRELKSNSGAFTIAIANPDAAAAARQAGADLVLSKPIVPDQARYALLACDQFLCHMKVWLPKLGFPAAAETATRSVASKPWPPAGQEKRAEEALPSRPAQPSALVHDAIVASYLPVGPAVPIFEDDFYQRSHIQTIFQSMQPNSESMRLGKAHGKFLRGIAVGIAFLSVGYVFSEPLRGHAVAISVAKIYGSALAKAQNWLQRSYDDRRPVPKELAETVSAQPADYTTDSTHIRIMPVTHASAASEQPQSLPAEVQPAQKLIAATTTRIQVPESLNMPISGVTVRNVAARFTPSLLAALEPVDLPEDLSQKLLLQKVQPSYPEQALRVGLQGPVVLQAWIARDGTIRDLKLIRGSLLLGKAAYNAVRQWRYQPCVRNGRAVEAMTYVTVDFRLH
jgi:TonB family protein